MSASKQVRSFPAADFRTAPAPAAGRRPAAAALLADEGRVAALSGRVGDAPGRG
ncbi:hypothetical protein [Streptomyces sp. NPDC029003]|uniref:hypothetical protein n=1 Tax=Streptomyces sp. NPDC029003 TaxID=3155125 RepID=UPI0033EAAB0D